MREKNFCYYYVEGGFGVLSKLREDHEDFFFLRAQTSDSMGSTNIQSSGQEIVSVGRLDWHRKRKMMMLLRLHLENEFVAYGSWRGLAAGPLSFALPRLQIYFRGTQLTQGVET